MLFSRVSLCLNVIIVQESVKLFSTHLLMENRKGQRTKMACSRNKFKRIYACLSDIDWDFVFDGCSTDECYELFLDL